jgi:hypothetical protein
VLQVFSGIHGGISMASRGHGQKLEQFCWVLVQVWVGMLPCRAIWRMRLRIGREYNAEYSSTRAAWMWPGGGGLAYEYLWVCVPMVLSG